MNTVTAYATRARAARVAARDLAAADRHLTREDDERAARLADYASRCDALANIADGDRDTAAFRAAGDYADQAHAAWSVVRHRREALHAVIAACDANDREALTRALRYAQGPHMSDRERDGAQRAAKRLAWLPDGRPAVDALSWSYGRSVGLTAEQVDRIHDAAAATVHAA